MIVIRVIDWKYILELIMLKKIRKIKLQSKLKVYSFMKNCYKVDKNRVSRNSILSKASIASKVQP